LRTKFEFQEYTSYLSVFSSGRIIHFTVNRPTLLNGKDTCIPWKYTIKVGSSNILHTVSFRAELAPQRNTPYLPTFSSGRHIHLKEKKPVMLNGRETCKCWNHSMEIRSL
jgi:hypothetical protein